MRSVHSEINPKGFSETCNWHSLQRLVYRASDDLLKEIDFEQVRKKQEINDFHDNVGDISKAKYRRLPNSAARGINSYLDSKIPDEADKLRMCKIIKPVGWKPEFNDESNILSPTDAQLKKKLMNAKKSFPQVKVSFDSKVLLSLNHSILIIIFSAPKMLDRAHIRRLLMRS